MVCDADGDILIFEDLSCISFAARPPDFAKCRYDARKVRHSAQGLLTYLLLPVHFPGGPALAQLEG